MTGIEFKRTVQRETQSLRHYAYQLTRNVEDTNDLVQDTMLKALTYQDKFTDGTNLKGWLYTIMKNTFINNYRRMVKRNTFIDQTDNDYYLDSVSHSVKNDAEKKFMLNDIEQAIEALPPSLRKPFTMNTKGFKYHEIAEILHIPIGTVKTRIFVARRQLREQLNGYAKIYGLENVM
ncbi:MAG: RNA polymerase sigma factor [Bacteroidia bacterium]|jgi:RNA polymerase sigma-70 factor (ECF subfamily)|nr:RNA polymerase sigma factor [Bacteroidia bacterium]